jgi:hypothetical protein
LLSRKLFDEVEEATEGAGGTGEIPMIAIQVGAGSDPEVYIAMKEDDFRILASEKLNLVSESKAEARRRQAEVPQLFRADDYA